MSYSTATMPNVESEIPAPPLYAVWLQQPWQVGNQGIVRHVPSLTKAKKYVTCYSSYGGTDRFRGDWSIYHWDYAKAKYVRVYEGKAGDVKEDNPLFRMRIKKGSAPVREVPEEEVQAALASIAKASA